jgi:hypothetical protein
LLPGARSSLANAGHRPASHLARDPCAELGLAMRREKKRFSGVTNMPAFSMKNGRFSGKNTSKRWLIVTRLVRLDVLKSGLSVRSKVTHP